MSFGLSEDKLVSCRHCNRAIPEAREVCTYCGGYAPGIISKCPSCGSENYVVHTTGFSLGKAAGGMILLGPLGLAAGVLGSGKPECVCKRCKQGWLPLAWGGGKGSVTKKFSSIPSDCK